MAITYSILRLKDEFLLKSDINANQPDNETDALKHYIACHFLRKTNESLAIDYLKKYCNALNAIKETNVSSITITGKNITENKAILYYQLIIENDNELVKKNRQATFCIEDYSYFLIKDETQNIRIIGDDILHQPGILFPKNPSNQETLSLYQQIEIAKHRLIESGGGGIAANQCQEIKAPYQFAIVGVFKNEPLHVTVVNFRYPGNDFPDAMVMLNPIIIAKSRQNYRFFHGCLSVPCRNRFEIESPKYLQVKYLDPLDEMRTKTYIASNDAAVALWHEMNHILGGLTYIDTALQRLSKEQLLSVIFAVEKALENKNNELVPDLGTKPFLKSIQIDHNGHVNIDNELLKEALFNMNDETLEGILSRGKAIAQMADTPSSSHWLTCKEEIRNESSRTACHSAIY